MTYPKFGATFFDLGLQLPRQILTKSKKFQNSKIFFENSNLNLERIFPKKRLMIRIYKWLQKAFSKWLMGYSIIYLLLPI